jgi:hypothetical protein
MNPQSQPVDASFHGDNADECSSRSGRDASFDVAPDGRRFVMIKSDDASTLRQLTVVQNLFEELKPLIYEGLR